MKQKHVCKHNMFDKVHFFPRELYKHTHTLYLICFFKFALITSNLNPLCALLSVILYYIFLFLAFFLRLALFYIIPIFFIMFNVYRIVFRGYLNVKV